MDAISQVQGLVSEMIESVKACIGTPVEKHDEKSAPDQYKPPQKKLDQVIQPKKLQLITPPRTLKVGGLKPGPRAPKPLKAPPATMKVGGTLPGPGAPTKI